MEHVCKIEACYGCYACYNICPKHAISMREDACGTIIPTIQQETCVDCGLCQRVCPALHESEFALPQQVYAAVAKDTEDYKASTSGGIATTFAKKMISDGGIVYGASAMDDLTVQHTRASTMEELERQRGSKYVQSAVGDSYRRVKQDLENEKPVLFVGTPCQVDGLLHFLGHKYEKLITVNLICHGVPANRLLIDNLNKSVDKREKLSFSFRNDKGFALTVSQGSRTVYRQDFYKDPYFLGFMRKLFYRNTCYTCKYAQRQRVGDITIGDFWGFDKGKPFIAETPYGLSVVLLNTQAGKRFFEECADCLLIQRRDLDEAVAGNPQLSHPSQKHRNYEKFRRLYRKCGFQKAARKSLWMDMMGYRLFFLKHRIFR